MPNAARCSAELRDTGIQLLPFQHSAILGMLDLADAAKAVLLQNSVRRITPRKRLCGNNGVWIYAASKRKELSGHCRGNALPFKAWKGKVRDLDAAAARRRLKTASTYGDVIFYSYIADPWRREADDIVEAVGGLEHGCGFKR